jgi:hypothetical protein
VSLRRIQGILSYGHTVILVGESICGDGFGSRSLPCYPVVDHCRNGAATLDFISGGWVTSLKLLGTVTVAYLLLLWFASILWAYRDIRSRTMDPISQAIGVAVVALLPLFGVAIYLIVRPSETLAESYERELEQEAIRSELHSLAPCPNCRRPVERDFVVCAYCRTPVREECSRCRKLLSLDWRHCPYCGTSKPARPEPVRSAALGSVEDYEEGPAELSGRNSGGRPRSAGAPPVAQQTRPRRARTEEP